MRKKRHLTLIEAEDDLELAGIVLAESPPPEPGEWPVFIPASVRAHEKRKPFVIRLVQDFTPPDPLKNSRSAKEASIAAAHPTLERLKEMLSELANMDEVVGCGLLMLRTLRAHEAEVGELRSLLEMLDHGRTVLQTYADEFDQIARMQLTPPEERKLTKGKYVLKQLRRKLPESIDEVVMALQRRRALEGSTKGGTKAVTLNSPIVGGEKKRSDKRKFGPGKKTAISGKLNGIRLKVSLDGTEPLIWRRLQVPGNCSLGELHFTIQQAMGWEDYHLHFFSLRGDRYSAEGEDRDENAFTLADFAWRPGQKIQYVYDLGDCWMHTVEFEGFMDSEFDKLECVDGRMACPPEDSGGVAGFYWKLEVLRNPRHAEYDHIRQWMGDFDPAGY